ncbi:MAG: hypothetical protein ISQ06_08730 [Planctomycetaceae bacterium]|nr:hypothetical protein [Planctomycetaceae bacterium]
MRQLLAFRSLSVLIVTFLLVRGLLAQEAPGDSRKDKPDFRNPPRQYEDVTIDDRTFVVEAQLLREDAQLARRSLARLKKNIDLALEILPPHSHPFVAKQQFWMMYGPKATAGGRDNGLAYFRPGSPKFDAKRDERWNSVVVVYDAKNYVALSDLWAFKAVLHELAHAYQLEQWPEKEPHILAAYDNAMTQNLYRNVKDEKGGVFAAAYATQNQLEYFAETSCMFFARCNYQPYHRLELKEYDPVGYEMIRRQWKIGDEFGKPAPRAWKLGRSTRTLEATLKSYSSGKVTLVEPSGKERTISLKALGEVDQDIVKRWFGE